MDMKVMDKINDEFCKVLQKYAETGLRSENDVLTAKAAASGLVKLKMLEEMEKYQGSSFGYRDSGYSEGYRDGMSGRRYHDDGGSYGYRDGGYSGHDIKAQLMEKLRGMKDQAHNEQEKRMVDDWIRRFEQN